MRKINLGTAGRVFKWNFSLLNYCAGLVSSILVFWFIHIAHCAADSVHAVIALLLSGIQWCNSFFLSFFFFLFFFFFFFVCVFFFFFFFFCFVLKLQRERERERERDRQREREREREREASVRVCLIIVQCTAYVNFFVTHNHCTRD